MTSNKKTNLALAVFFLAALCLIGISASVFAYPTIPSMVVTPLADMPKGQNVKGRDVGASFTFAGQSVFLFGDSSLDVSPGWVVNTMYRTADNNGDDNITGGYNYPASGSVPQRFIPYNQIDTDWNNSHQGQGFIGLWPPVQSVFQDPNTGKFYTWFDKVIEKPDGSYPGVGAGFAEITSLTLTAQRIEHRPSAPVNPVSGVAEKYLMFDEFERPFSKMALVPTGTQPGNGYLYGYYCDGKDFANIRVARAPLANEGFKNRANWRFYNGSNFDSANYADASIITSAGSGSITWNSYLNCYLYTYMVWCGFEIQMRVADNPWGPWSAPVKVWTSPPPTNGNFNVLCMNHKILEKENGRTLYISYSEQMQADFTERIPMIRVRFNNTAASKALNKTATASSTVGSNTPAKAFDQDGDTSGFTRWESSASNTQWIRVDLGTNQTIGEVVLNWHLNYGRGYKIQTSTNGSTWYDRYTTTTGDGGIDRITFTPVTARYIRMYGTARGTSGGYSLWNMQAY